MGKDSDPLSLNLYTYAANNPVNLDDPSGHFFNFITAAIGAAVGAVVNTAINAFADYFDDGQFNRGWQSYAGAAVTGAIGGAAAGFTCGGSLLASTAAEAGVNAAAWGVGSVAGQYVANGSVNWGEAGWSAVGGGIGAGIGKYAGDYIGRTFSSGSSSLVSNTVSDTFTSSLDSGISNTYKPFSIDLQQFADNASVLSPYDIRFSQSSVNSAEGIIDSMTTNGWVGDSIDVVRMPDGLLTSIDNTRLLAAQYTGTNVNAVIHEYDEALFSDMLINRFTTPKGVPGTWGDALSLRIGNQNSVYRNTYPFGSNIIGWDGF